MLRTASLLPFADSAATPRRCSLITRRRHAVATPSAAMLPPRVRDMRDMHTDRHVAYA